MTVIERFYDVNAEREWARLTLEREPHRWLEFRVAMHLLDKYLPPVLSAARGPAPARVLDVGGGPGRYAIALTERGYRVTLFDLSGESLALGRRNAAEAGVADRIEAYEQGCATDLSRFPDGSFDAVLVMGPLYHLVEEADRLAAVRESLRVLRGPEPVEGRSGGIVAAAIINHLGVARSAATELVGWLGSPDALEIVRSYVNTAPPGDGGGFTEAYFAHPLELRDWYEAAGAETLTLAAQEGVAGGLRDACRLLVEHPAAWQNFVQIVLETCEDPTIVGGSEHTLYVGRKKES